MEIKKSLFLNGIRRVLEVHFQIEKDLIFVDSNPGRVGATVLEGVNSILETDIASNANCHSLSNFRNKSHRLQQRFVIISIKLGDQFTFFVNPTEVLM